jgi:hypothetical protein
MLTDLGAPVLAAGKVARSAILAYIDGWNEREVVVLPESVRNVVVGEIATGS